MQHDHSNGCTCGHGHGHEVECCRHHEHEHCGCGHVHGQNTATSGLAADKNGQPKERAFAGQDPNKGVSLGAEVEREVADVMRRRYHRFLSGDEAFEVKTEVCHNFGYVGAKLSNPSRTVSVEVEVSVECEPNKIGNPIDAYNRALDVLDLVYLDYFDSDRISHYLPVWQAYEIDGQTVNVRLEHANPALDDEASAFLLAHGFLEGGLSPDEYDDDDSDEDD